MKIRNKNFFSKKTRIPFKAGKVASLSLIRKIVPSLMQHNSLQEIPATAVVTENDNHPHVGYLNHGYSKLSVPTHSRPGSVIDLNFDKMSHKSSRWGDDDDLPDWDTHAPNDSGLHSLAVSAAY